MHRAVPLGAALVFAVLAVAVASRPAAAKPVRLHLFNLAPSTAYQVAVPGLAPIAVFTGVAASLVTAFDAAPGDLVGIQPVDNPDLQPPAPPSFTGLASDGAGCAVASWSPSGDPTVTGYVVSLGRVPAADGAGYEQTVEVAAGSSVRVCSLEKGMHYFAVQARNYAGMLSGYSAERSVEIVVVAVLISRFDARVTRGGVQLTWSIIADELVRGYRVYRTGPDGTERALSPDALAATESSLFDRDVVPGTTYTYVLGAIGEDGGETRSVPVTLETPALALALGQNAPNPFNPGTSIPIVLDTASRVLLRVYDVRGARVATLFDGALPAGAHVIAWDGRDARGRPVVSGTYLYSLVAGKHRLARKMQVLR
ncbi:MAG TPA: FlgD immunoglobulin-like domain containing protein [Candidatus Krumholzibacteria bacterium]|nr:FlgD immunoglobulin-like domain containing protein [Candidatus Krumholzibacteria bacterium]